MKLYLAKGRAPNPGKLRLYLAEKAFAGNPIDIACEYLDLGQGEQKSAGHLQRNPLGKVPVLQLDDGSTISESLSIIEYLEELYPQAPMIGRTALERVRVRELARIADLRVLLAAGHIVKATDSRADKMAKPEIAEHFRGVLESGLRLLNARLADGRRFLAGDQPSIADCSCAACLQYGRSGGVAIDEAFAHLLRWEERYFSRQPALTVYPSS